MKKIKLVCGSLLLILFCQSSPGYAGTVTVRENQQAVWSFDEYDAVTLGANMLINGMIGASSAYLQENDQLHLRMFKSRTFWRNFSQGALGGSLVYVGEKTMTMSSQYDYAILLGKQVSDLGTSITYSASYGENWFKNPSYITDIGPVVLHWNRARGLKPKVYLLPGSMIALTNNLLTNKLEIEESFKTGLFIFEGKIEPNLYANFPAQGQCFFNIVTLNPEEIRHDSHSNTDYYWQYREIIAHEAIHTRWSYFQLMALDSSIDHYLAKQTNGLQYLRYERQPFRFGADIGGLLFSGLSYTISQSGLEYEFTPDEYASSNLFDYQRATTIHLKNP